MKKLFVLLSALMAISAYADAVFAPANDVAADRKAAVNFLKLQNAKLGGFTPTSYDEDTGTIGYFMSTTRPDSEGTPVTQCFTISFRNEDVGGKIAAHIVPGSYQVLASCIHSE